MYLSLCTPWSCIYRYVHLGYVSIVMYTLFMYLSLCTPWSCIYRYVHLGYVYIVICVGPEGSLNANSGLDDVLGSTFVGTCIIET